MTVEEFINQFNRWAQFISSNLGDIAGVIALLVVVGSIFIIFAYMAKKVLTGAQAVTEASVKKAFEKVMQSKLFKRADDYYDTLPDQTKAIIAIFSRVLDNIGGIDPLPDEVQQFLRSASDMLEELDEEEREKISKTLQNLPK